MGTWGVGVLQDDTAADVVAFIRDRLKAGDQLQSATDAAVSHFAELKGDSDEEPLLWLAVAHVQWKYGIVNADVLRKIRLDIESENGLDRWRDDPKDFARR